MNNKLILSPLKFSVFNPLCYLSVGIILFLTNCDSVQEKQSKVKTYYDLKGFMETQISSLDKEKPEVTKIMQVAGKKETRSSRDIDWKKELELFIQADINKPAYSKSYQVHKPDSLTVIYGLKTSEILPVVFLKIKLDKASGYPTTIKALLRSENKLYQSIKNIELHGTVIKNQWQLTDYTIDGFQKLVTMDKKFFNVATQVEH